MSYIALKKTAQTDDPGADRTFETDSESLIAAADILNTVDELEDGEALVIWKVVF